MPADSQLLYFHMVLRADDDGIVESYPLMKLLGSPPDAFSVLIAKGLILQLNTDQVVVVTDWLEHNVIRADRKVDSIYKHLLPPEQKTIEAKPRSDVVDNSRRVGGPSTDGIGKVRLGKGRSGKDREEKRTDTITVASDGKDISEIINLFKEVNPAYSKLFARKPQREAVRRLLAQWPRPKLDNIIKVLPETNAEQYAPTITTPLQLEDSMGKLKAFIQKRRTKTGGVML